MINSVYVLSTTKINNSIILIVYNNNNVSNINGNNSNKIQWF